jgi:hypothetical protein
MSTCSAEGCGNLSLKIGRSHLPFKPLHILIKRDTVSCLSCLVQKNQNQRLNGFRSVSSVMSGLRYKVKRWLCRAQRKIAFVKRILFLYAQPAVWRNRKSADSIENPHIPINACILYLITIAIVWKHRRTLKSRTLLNFSEVIN